MREKDTVFRYGGDEFVAVLSSCDLNTAKNIAERIRESVEKKKDFSVSRVDPVHSPKSDSGPPSSVHPYACLPWYSIDGKDIS